MDLCYSKTWPDKQVVLRLVLWPEEVRGGGTDAKKPTGEAGFFAIPDRSW